MKKYNWKVILLFTFLLGVIFTHAQVAITADESQAGPSVMLEIKSTDKGLLIPRLTKTQIENIENPANSLLVFCTTDDNFYTFLSAESIWKNLDFGEELWFCGQDLTDSRDDQTYSTVFIGNKCWMAENLNIGTRIDGGNDMNDNSILEKFCYNDDIDNCNVYGGLYQWNEMMQYTTQENTQGICPDGWILPSENEWLNMIEFLGGSSVAGGELKETGTTHWATPNTGATNNSGFTALPGGIHNGTNFTYFGDWGDYWISKENSETNALIHYLSKSSSAISRANASKTDARSVRCIKN